MTAQAIQTADPLDRSAARRLVDARVRQSGTSFFWAMRLLPRARREAMFAVYAFCREVDDIADDGGSQAERLAGLARWRAEIAALYQGRPTLPVSVALLDPVTEFSLRRSDFLDVIDGMEMDAREDIRAPGLADLDLYCDRVASATGRLSVFVFGVPDERGIRLAHHLGRALQLTNILRDLAEDSERGRLYLPRELLVRHGIEETDPQSVLRHPAVSAACREVAGMAREHFTAAAGVLDECPRARVRPAATMHALYGRLLERLVAADWRDLRQPVSVPTGTKLWLALRYGLL